MKLYRVVTPYFVAGVEVEGGIVRRAAPILGWMKGGHIDKLTGWCRRKGFHIELVD